MGTNWRHWSRSGTPTPDTLVVDMYPDLREFEPGETCAVPGMTIGGNPAHLFSSGNSKTVDRHFRWMQQYGLDGVLVQRFVSEAPGLRSAGDPVLRSVLAAARRYQRVFALEYDTSGANPATLVSALQEDWRYLVETLQLTAHPGYLRHNGKPVLGVWGIGLSGTNRPNDPDAALRLLEWFRDVARVSYLGGTPGGWRTLNSDAATDPRWAGFYQAMDIIQPWAVGRYNSISTADRWRTERLQPDQALIEQRGQVYMPVIFPGFSWFNLMRPTAPQNQIPRNRGEFLWRQAYNARAAGARTLKIAMFDEVDESTAMFKLASRRADAPDQGFWLTLDADGFTLPSDWYLRLAGEVTRVFRGQTPLSTALPSNPGPPYAEAPVVTAVNGANFKPGVGAAGAIVTVYGERLRTDRDLLQSGLALIDSSGAARAPAVLFASSGQLNLVVPEGIAAGPATLAVEREDGSLAFGRLQIQPTAPGLFTAAASGAGPAAAYVRVLRPDATEFSSLVATCNEAGVCQAAPIDLGPPGSVAVLELYGTGIRGRTSLEAVTCRIGSQNVAVLFAGSQGGFPGLDQVNVSLPRSLAGAGTVTVRLSVDGVEANVTELAFR
jgi:uncharacterized protein (TIGR03437 family)